MTLLEQLQAHKGGLIQLKTQLYWYDGRGWDGDPARVCLLLDATASAASAAAAGLRAAATPRHVGPVRAAAAAFLLIDGQPQWIWVAKEDIALLVNDPPTN